jgi:tetratricopeptide (TPR) repeat protein
MGSFATIFHPESKPVDKSEYDQTTSEFATAYDDQGLDYGAEDQYDQIISDLNKAVKIDPEYAEACCNRGRAYDATGECNFAELQKDYTQMKTIKHFRLHVETCDIYAIEQWSDGRLVGSCGPLTEDDLKDLNSYGYSDEQNNWVQENIDRLILWFP